MNVEAAMKKEILQLREHADALEGVLVALKGSTHEVVEYDEPCSGGVWVRVSKRKNNKQKGK